MIYKITIRNHGGCHVTFNRNMLKVVNKTSSIFRNNIRK